MASLSWTKQQDFCLRLGFLKVLVAVLSPERRSENRDGLLRRLQSPLADVAAGHAELWRSVVGRMPWLEKEREDKEPRRPLVFEALLVAGDCPSFLYALTRPTLYKVLDWGLEFGFMGHGNQITERGLVLRSLLPADRVEAFFAGDPLAWNPFVLTNEERLFFLFHALETDRVLLKVVGALAERATVPRLPANEVAALVCRAMFELVEEQQDDIPPPELPRLRKVRELACTIAEELGLDDFVQRCSDVLARRVPKPKKPGGRGPPRKTTKNADHQTIPRCEQLVDLGFLRKPGGDDDHADPTEARRRWIYAPTIACGLWRARLEALRVELAEGPRLLYRHFADAAATAFGFGNATTTAERALHEFWTSYGVVRRPFGHTPFESVALHAMLRLAAAGIVVEVEDFHRQLLAIKKNGVLSDVAFFAAGNDILGMFVLLKKGFAEAASRALAKGALHV